MNEDYTGREYNFEAAIANPIPVPHFNAELNLKTAKLGLSFA